MFDDSSSFHQWVEQELNKQTDISLDGTLQLRPLEGDAGFRQYFTVNSTPALLAVVAPLESGLSESAEYFSLLSETLRSQGIPTPLIIACEPAKNWLLVERFVGVDLHAQLTDHSVDWLYGEALLVLLRLQQIPRTRVNVDSYDAQVLLRELLLFKEWFVQHLLGYELSKDEHPLIDELFSCLVDLALEQPQVCVHRDYHSRNLIYREAEAPGVIDFQDALWGPFTYDVVSLLKDCYIRWSPEQVNRWLLAYGNMAYETGVLPLVSKEVLMRWFDTMGLQRHIKVLGIFARLSIRDGKNKYLNDLPLVIRYVLEAAEKYPQSHLFAQWFKKELLPLCEQQSWYSDYIKAGDRQ